MNRLVKKSLLLGLFFATSNSFAQLPELVSPTSATGIATTARFFGGATADNGSTYANSFAYDAAIDIDLEIQVEASHVNTVGNLYVIVIWDGSYFVRDENGAFQLWDLSIENFLAASPAKTLQASERISIVDDVAFGPAGVSDTSLGFIVAYDTMAVANEFFFNGVSLSVNIEAEVEDLPSVVQSLQLFTNSVSSQIIQSNCIYCHINGGSAGGTSLAYQSSSNQNALNTNYNLLVNYINGGKGSTLLSKSKGIGHGGGVRLSSSSSDFQNFEAFVNAVLAE
ncbi:MAG: hypothetical protein CMQ08_04510 [Gammaproteobacteria bacterium]|nr:hypothetical protein [Gammaproteobacteria bacterium]